MCGEVIYTYNQHLMDAEHKHMYTSKPTTAHTHTQCVYVHASMIGT